MSTATNVSTGKPKVGGAIYRAPLGTALPTDAKTALTEVYKNLGYASDAGVVNSNSPQSGKELAAGVWVIDMIMRGGILKRVVIPNGTITEVGDVTYADESAVGYEVTVTAVPDSAGNTHYEYMSKPAAA